MVVLAKLTVSLPFISGHIDDALIFLNSLFLSLYSDQLQSTWFHAVPLNSTLAIPCRFSLDIN